MNRSLAVQWAFLDHHFQHHARMVHRFRDTDRDAVIRMWQRQTNEDGERLSQFKREALIERYCELFGIWLGKGKTPVLTAEEAGELLRSIHTGTVVGLRDRALIGEMVFTFARVSAA